MQCLETRNMQCLEPDCAHSPVAQGRPYMQEQESSNVSIGCAITINVGSYTASFTALHASRASARHAGSLASASRVQLPVI